MREIKFRMYHLELKNYFENGTDINSIAYNSQFEMIDLNRVLWEQYTGLKDKNGVEIYEGDIVHVQSHLYKDHIGKIIWSQGTAGFCISDNTNEFNIPRPLGIQMDGFLSYEVIGNVHQNANLLDDTDRISPDDIGNDIHEFLHKGDK